MQIRKYGRHNKWNSEIRNMYFGELLAVYEYYESTPEGKRMGVLHR